MRTITLLHDRNFLNDLLEVCVHRDLFDSEDLSRLLVVGFVNAAIGSEKISLKRKGTLIQD